MMDRLRSWLPLLPLLALLGATYWLNLQVQPASVTSGKIRHDPDYIVDNFTATSLDKTGKIRFVMSAQKMVHYPDDDTTVLEAPKISSYAAEYPPMRITAQDGEVSSKGDDVYLRHNVTIIRPAYADKSELTFLTDYLHVVPQKNYADTDHPVSMYDARARLDAVGMELDGKARNVKFLSHVTSVYEPRKK